MEDSTPKVDALALVIMGVTMIMAPMTVAVCMAHARVLQAGVFLNSQKTLQSSMTLAVDVPLAWRHGEHQCSQDSGKSGKTLVIFQPKRAPKHPCQLCWPYVQ